jgi:uncharacterized protein YecE (DUF72 family)
MPATKSAAQSETASSGRPRLLLGTSSWTAPGWKGAFYPRALPSSEQLTYYATQFPTVEIDSTFYAIPAASTVTAWAQRTPSGFLFAAKVPKIITHDKVLVDAEDDVDAFCSRMELLGSRLGPLLLQFPHFSRSQIPGINEFLIRLRPFLRILPTGFRWALEIRNRTWLTPELLDLLREHDVAFTLIDHPAMPGPNGYGPPDRWLTSSFSYIRWVGDRRKIEEMTTQWDHTVLDRAADLERWANVIRASLPKAAMTFGFANNHYGGFAPESLQLFNRIWGGGLLSPRAAAPQPQQLTLL